MHAILRTLALVMIVAVAGTAHARDRSNDEAAAQAAYRAGDFASATSSWRAVLESEENAASPSERARVLYNLGNTAFRAGRTLEAVGWYTASLRLRPRDAETWHNLEYARNAAKLEPADRGDLSATLNRLFSSLTLAESEWLVIAVVLAWAGVLAMEALRGGRLWRNLSFVGAFLVAASFVPWAFSLSRASADTLLAIQDGKLGVKSEPRADAAVIAEANAGDELERLDTLPDWTKVELADGTVGWVEGRSVFALER
jgi:tetratricopeptide (TPR) repeat protein